MAHVPFNLKIPPDLFIFYTPLFIYKILLFSLNPSLSPPISASLSSVLSFLTLSALSYWCPVTLRYLGEERIFSAVWDLQFLCEVSGERVWVALQASVCRCPRCALLPCNSTVTTLCGMTFGVPFPLEVPLVALKEMPLAVLAQNRENDYACTALHALAITHTHTTQVS